MSISAEATVCRFLAKYHLNAFGKSHEKFLDRIFLSQWNRSKRGIKLGTKRVICQKLEILHRERIRMLTGLRVTSLASKYEFYRPEHIAKGDPWN